MLSKEQQDYVLRLRKALIDVGHTDAELLTVGPVAAVVVRSRGRSISISLNDWDIKQPVRRHLERIRCVLGPTELERSFN